MDSSAIPPQQTAAKQQPTPATTKPRSAGMRPRPKPIPREALNSPGAATTTGAVDNKQQPKRPSSGRAVTMPKEEDVAAAEARLAVIGVTRKNYDQQTVQNYFLSVIRSSNSQKDSLEIMNAADVLRRYAAAVAAAAGGAHGTSHQKAQMVSEATTGQRQNLMMGYRSDDVRPRDQAEPDGPVMGGEAPRNQGAATSKPRSAGMRPRPKPIPRETLNSPGAATTTGAVDNKQQPKRPSSGRAVTMPKEEDVAAAEARLAVIGVTRKNYDQQTVQNYFLSVIRSSNSQKDSLEIMNAADVLRRYAAAVAAAAGGAHGTSHQKAETVPVSGPSTGQRQNAITDSGCWMVSDKVRIGRSGLVPSSSSSSNLGASASELGSPERTVASPVVSDGSFMGGENQMGNSCNSLDGSQRRSMKLEDLEELRVLGAGAQGTVSLKRWRLTGDLYAVKELTISSDMDRKQQEYVTQELRNLIHAPSDYIVPLYQAYLRRPMLTIVQQYMDVGSLEDVLKVHPKLPTGVVAAIAVQLFHALREMSLERKQLHRDIKPANILLNSKGEVKLADFGVASNIKTLGGSSFIGTTTYMSPERVRGERYSSPSDVWAVGLVLAECLVGEFPFKYHNFMELFNKITSQQKVEFNDDVPECARVVIWSCLEQKPSDRVTAEKALYSEWLMGSTPADHRAALKHWIEIEQVALTVHPHAVDDSFI
eukprot:PhM_4_TR3062/c3_g1_i5/m.103104